MNFKSLFSFFVFCFFYVSSTTAQKDVFTEYGITPGLRIGQSYENWYSFSARKNFRAGSAELILTPSKTRFTITGLYALQFPIGGDIEGLSYFYGGGAHVGLQSDFAPAIGIDGIMGLEYEVPGFPILVSIDMKPGYDFTGGFGPRWQEGALTVRYVIGG
jgi:hypothetical protein|tara:strand:+ start:208 stop:687 length:480 start_codon:yes stop_codon:yes gene_type:complete